MKIKFTKEQLGEISHSCAILRACDMLPFPLANNINCCKAEADLKLKQINELVAERQKEGKENTEANDLKFEIEIPELKEVDFNGLNISGYKEVHSQIGMIKFLYRDAYFNLKGVIIN